MRRVRAVVSGRVQGVWFRESTRRAADAAGISGWVRNLPDGRVEALLEGESGAVATVLAFLHEGPPMARVEHVSLEEERADAPTERGFRIG